MPTLQTYHFSFNKEGELRIFPTTGIKSEEELLELKPSTLQNLHLQHISIVGEYDKEGARNEGQWKLRFPKGDTAIDEAWRLLVEAVKAARLYKVKISEYSSAEEQPFQVISVYSRDQNDVRDVLRVYQYLEEKGLLAASRVSLGEKGLLQQGALKYNVWRGMLNSEATVYEDFDTQLMKILVKLQDHKYVLHGGGEKVAGKVYSKSAALILRKIFDYFKQTPSVDKCNEVLKYTDEQLKFKTEATRGCCFFGLGGRDQTTAQLYKEIIAEQKNLLSVAEECIAPKSPI